MRLIKALRSRIVVEIRHDVWIRPCKPYVERAVAGLTRFSFVGALWMDSLQGLTALVVDDDSDIRKSLARILRLAGAEVSVTSSAEDALQLLEENRWDVVVTDIGMPRLSGYDLIRQARQRGHRVPMIAVTAFDTPEYRRQIFRHGFAYHLAKPFDPDYLVAVVGETARIGSRAAPALTHDTKTSVGPGVAIEKSIRIQIKAHPETCDSSLRAQTSVRGTRTSAAPPPQHGSVRRTSDWTWLWLGPTSCDSYAAMRS